MKQYTMYSRVLLLHLVLIIISSVRGTREMLRLEIANNTAATAVVATGLSPRVVVVAARGFFPSPLVLRGAGRR